MLCPCLPRRHDFACSNMQHAGACPCGEVRPRSTSRGVGAFRNGSVRPHHGRMLRSVRSIGCGNQIDASAAGSGSDAKATAKRSRPHIIGHEILRRVAAAFSAAVLELRQRAGVPEDRPPEERREPHHGRRAASSATRSLGSSIGGGTVHGTTASPRSQRRCPCADGAALTQGSAPGPGPSVRSARIRDPTSPAGAAPTHVCSSHDGDRDQDDEHQ
jgi:hypothetical protein